MPTTTATARGFERTDGDATMRVEFLQPGIVRIRQFTGPEPPMPSLLRYGFFERAWPEIPVAATGSGAASELLSVSVDDAGCLTIADAEGTVLLTETEPALPGPTPGFRMRFGLSPDARLVGLGDQNRERIEHRGMSGDLWVRNVDSYIPIPLLISSEGYGLLINTTRRIYYDLGATSEEWFGFEAEDESVDWYFIHGPSPAEVLDRYTQITGRPMMPPKYALGLWFICRTQADAHEFTSDCLNFRREGIPCDCIGLEPGWMDQIYDYSIDKKWSTERFPVPSYNRFRHTFFATAQRMGFKPGLWLCMDYDLSWEEERRLAPEVLEAEESERAGFSLGHEVDEHLRGKRYFDQLTRPDVPWFEHLSEFVDEGAHWFKQDGSNQILEHPDRLWGNGMSDAEMHNLYPMLYSRQMLQGYREHTDRRTFVFTCSGWAGLQALTGTWTGDTGGEEGPLVACLNLSLSGHGMNTCDMEVTTPEGIHFGMLLPWAQLNSWNYWRHPWLQGERLRGIFAFYARLRYQMLPYIYSAAWTAHESGLPMMRAMPLEWPDSAAAYECLRQYLLGPNLLVASFTDELWLPPGQWYNFWTGERIEGDCWVTPEVPDGRGGPLMARAGGILPMGPEMDFVGQRPDDELDMHVWAGPASDFTLYEDDGITHEFENGAHRTTQIAQEPIQGGIRVIVSAPEGDFAGAMTRPDSAEARDGNFEEALPGLKATSPVSERALRVFVHGLETVSAVSLNGEMVAPEASGPRPRWCVEASGDLVIDLGRRDLSAVEIVVC